MFNLSSKYGVYYEGFSVNHYIAWPEVPDVCTKPPYIFAVFFLTVIQVITNTLCKTYSTIKMINERVRGLVIALTGYYTQVLCRECYIVVVVSCRSLLSELCLEPVSIVVMLGVKLTKVIILMNSRDPVFLWRGVL